MTRFAELPRQQSSGQVGPTPVNIGLDASHSLSREPSGVTVYCRNLIRTLAQIAPEDRFFLCYRANRFLKALGASLPGSNCSRRLLEEFSCFLFGKQLDLFHSLTGRLPRYRFERTVTTFHDVFFLAGDYCTQSFRSRFDALAREAAERSDFIITVSAFTAGQVEEYLGYPRDRIKVIHSAIQPIPGYTDQQLQRFKERFHLSAPFVLHVGTIQKRKNVRRLLEAFEGLETKHLLVLAGAPNGYGSEEILEYIEKSPARDQIRCLGYVDPSVLCQLYRSATMLAFPSLYEGFGFPLLEAMAADLPVMTSNCSSLSELANDAALLVDPEDTGAIQSGLQEILSNPDLRERLVHQGRQRVSQFSWERTAGETLALYRQLAND